MVGEKIGTDIGLKFALYGFIYVASGFIGILLHSELNPANLVKGIKEEFSNSEDVQNAIKSDINQTVNTIKSIIND